MDVKSLARRSAFGSALLALTLAPATAGVAAPVTPVSLGDLRDPNVGAPLHADPSIDRPALEGGGILEAGHPRYRPARIDVTHYDIQVAVDPLGKGPGTVRGVVTLDFKADVQELDWFILDAVAMTIEGVKLADGSALAFTYDGTLLTINLPRALAKGEAARVAVAYETTAMDALFLTGPDATDPSRMPAGYTFTEPEGSSLWYPCLDRPADKATATIRVSVPKGYNALSNGLPLGSSTIGDTTTFGYLMEQPIATYLVSLAVGRYEVLSIPAASPTPESVPTPLTLWTPPAIRDAALVETARTARMMEVFYQFTGLRYPFATYAQSIAQAWRTSMEHQTATTMGGWRIVGDGSGESVVAHELAHQWFGDWVTCRNWGELWLNEGFASYLPYVFHAAEGEADRALGTVVGWRAGYFGEAASGWAHALSQADPDMSDIFDSHAYEKGALVIHLLRSLANATAGGEPTTGPAAPVDEEVFTKALTRYLLARGRDTATSMDLQVALEAATGTSWQLFFDQWVRSAGHPVLTVASSWKDGVLTLAVEQTQSTAGKWRAFTFPLAFDVVQADGEVVRKTFDVYDDEHVFSVALAEAPLGVVADPEWIVPAEITLPQDEAAWTAVLTRSPFAPSRVTALRELAKLSPTAVSAVVLETVIHDESATVQATALELWSADSANRAAVEALAGSWATDGAPQDLVTRSAAARAEEWLVRTQGVAPSVDQEGEWQRRYLASGLQAERKALLNMLDFASHERAQQFALARIAEPQRVTQDRSALVDVLARAPTPAVEAFLAEAVGNASRYYRSVILSSLVAAGYDSPSVVEPLLARAADDREFGLRAASLKLLAVQRKSAARICPELPALMAVGLGTQRPEDLLGVREAAKRASAELGCAP
jgi:hypothetical protein